MSVRHFSSDIVPVEILSLLCLVPPERLRGWRASEHCLNKETSTMYFIILNCKFVNLIEQFVYYLNIINSNIPNVNIPNLNISNSNIPNLNFPNSNILDSNSNILNANIPILNILI